MLFPHTWPVPFIKNSGLCYCVVWRSHIRQELVDTWHMWLERGCPGTSDCVTMDIIFPLAMVRTAEIDTVRERNHCEKHQSGTSPF